MALPEPDDLFDLDSDRPELSGAVLVHALDGFVDAGNAVRLARTHLLADDDQRVLARFDADALYDYRARRPVMRFERDHWEGFETPELELRLAHDLDAVPYLLLTGPEPDVLWERFAAAVRSLVDRLGVRLSVGLGAFPMSVPHTRPVRVIRYGTRPELLAGYRPWLGSIAVPGSMGNLLEYRLGQAGHDAMGLGAPIPPYLAQSEFPTAAVALLRDLGEITGLRLDLQTLEAAAATHREAVDREVEQSDEVRELVRALEEGYDIAVRGAENSLLAADAELPSADELGAELERFLAERGKGDERSS